MAWEPWHQLVGIWRLEQAQGARSPEYRGPDFVSDATKSWILVILVGVLIVVAATVGVVLSRDGNYKALVKETNVPS
jgi:hypothetical protein